VESGICWHKGENKSNDCQEEQKPEEVNNQWLVGQLYISKITHEPLASRTSTLLDGIILSFCRM